MTIDSIVVGDIATNCYILSDPDTRKAWLIDPGDDEDRILSRIKKKDLTVEAIWLTHGHYDHCHAARRMAVMLGGVKIYAAKKEEEVLKNPAKNLSEMFTGLGTAYGADVYVADGDTFDLAGMTARVSETPGHTEGGICLYFPKEKVLISGDTLFCESLGRSDFPTGRTSTLIDSIINRLLVLPDDVDVYPGHNEPTTIGHEKLHNPVVPYIDRFRKDPL